MSDAAGPSDALLDEARRHIRRVTPPEALELQRTGALIIDTRSELARERDGIVAGSVHVPRTVLEWRADPSSPWSNPLLASHDGLLLVLCDHGWSSSLAALSLRFIGHDAGDVVGGMEAWIAMGLPTIPAPPVAQAEGELPGMGGREGEPAT